MRTSQDSPLIIAAEPTPNGGILGLTTCPGKKDLSRQWDRDLRTDIQAIAAWGASAVITLIEDHEFTLLGIEALGEEVVQLGMQWWHLPIRDVDVPDERFENLWQAVGSEVHARLGQGERILIHCRGGLGRTGLLAGRILVEQGVGPQDAIAQVRAARPGAIETRQQEAYVLRQGALS
jgi:ADP-ribosyl-[dinitrogen reductase] hydrolase